MSRSTGGRVSCVNAVLVASVINVLFATNAAAQRSPEFARAWDVGTPTTVIGTVTVIHADDFVRQESRVIHTIRDERTRESFHVRFEGTAPTDLRSGMRLQLSGRRYASGPLGP